MTKKKIKHKKFEYEANEILKNSRQEEKELSPEIIAHIDKVIKEYNRKRREHPFNI